MSDEDQDVYDQKFGSLVKDMDRYMVLEFEVNRKFKGISGLVAFTDDNSMVFLRSGYEEVVRPGEIWLCSVSKNENGIKYARPMDQVTLSMLMQMNENLRRAIEDSLWERNRQVYEDAFRQRFMVEEYARVRSEIDEESRKTVSDLESRIHELEIQLEQKQFALESMSVGMDDEEITLSSEPLRATQQQGATQYRDAEPLRAEEPGRQPLPRAFKVRRFGPRSFQSEYFTGRRCFVHISPSRKYVLVRFHDDGNIYCFNHTISIGGLERISDYVEGAEYNAEYSKRYEGILINLQFS
jgi:hypothetical protein